MAGNIYDQFVQPQQPENPYDQFLIPPSGANPETATPVTPQTSEGLGLYKGVTAPLDNAARGLEWVANNALPFGQRVTDDKGNIVVPGLGDTVDWLAKKAGFASPQEAQAAHKQYIAQQEAAGERPGALGEIAGNVLGTIPTMAMGPLAGGAATGALLTDKDTPMGVLGDAALGAGASYLGDKAIGALGRVVSPIVKPAVRKLLGEGVDLTPGQILGGSAQWLEDKAASLPILGDAIRNAKGRSINSFNRAAIQRVLTPVGETIPDTVPAGRAMVTHAGDVLDRKYKSLLPNLTVQPDATFNTNIANLRSLAKGLPGGRGQQFEDLYNNEITNNLTGVGKMSGNTMKNVESKLGQESRSYSSSPDPDQRKYGAAVGELQNQLRNLVERNNPAYRGQLRNINRGWATLTRIENAAGRTGANVEGQSGVFTPAQLQGAVRAGDSSVRKRGFARGTAMMQDLSDAGRSVLPSTVSNSGTVDRGLMAAGLMAAPNLFVHGMEAETLPVAAGLLGASALYSKPGTRALQAVFAQRPAVAPAIAQSLQSLRLPARMAAAPLALQYATGVDQ